MEQNGFMDMAPGGPQLVFGRPHDIAGPGRRAMTAMIVGRLSGPVIWITGPWADGRPCPDGLARFFDPARLVVARCARGPDALWAAEEALRAGAAPVVALEAAAPPALTPSRRLALAAEASRAPALCLILTPEGGAAAAQTRWRVDPLPGWAGAGARAGGAPRWRLSLLHDKAGPPGSWEAVGPPEACRAGPPRFLRAA